MEIPESVELQNRLKQNDWCKFVASSYNNGGMKGIVIEVNHGYKQHAVELLSGYGFSLEERLNRPNEYPARYRFSLSATNG